MSAKKWFGIGSTNEATAFVDPGTDITADDAVVWPTLTPREALPNSVFSAGLAGIQRAAAEMEAAERAQRPDAGSQDHAGPAVRPRRVEARNEDGLRVTAVTTGEASEEDARRMLSVAADLLAEHSHRQIDTPQ
jgi:hypothetical protein